MNTNVPTNHATERALGRIADAGLSGRKVLAVANEIAAKLDGEVAVLMTTLPEHIGSTDADFYARAESNGNQVWAIIRSHRVITLMLRRDNQPSTPEAMRVARVLHLQQGASRAA